MDSSGEVVGSLVLPASFRPTDISNDAILGVWVGDFDVESIRVYDYND